MNRDAHQYYIQELQQQNALENIHYENKLTKNIRPTDILQIYTAF